MKRILYLMHVPWGWIKQRPHFLAEHLSEDYELYCLFNKHHRINTTVANSVNKNVNLKQLFILPFSRFRLIEKFNRFLANIQIRPYIECSEIIWLTSPMQFEIIEDLVKDDHKVVYDCMDDLLELPGNSSNIFFRKRLLKYESRLLNRCNLVLASSNYLGDKLIERYGDIKNLHIVNNAIDIDVGMTVEGRLPSGLPQETTNIFSDINFLKLVYIGTISEWLDFNLIFESLKQFSNICYIFVGPNLLSVKHERIFFCGAVEHNKIYEIMNMADVLIMPFIVNELVKSVNPVKLYEYIYSCKPVISVKYDETLQFEDYVYLYSSETEYLQLISMSVNGNLPSKNSEHENKEFAYKNNWSNRTSTIKALLLQLCDNNVEI